MRIFSDFNRKIITTSVDICELQILMNVLRCLPCLWENIHDVHARVWCFVVVIIIVVISVRFHSQFQTEYYYIGPKLTFVVTYGGFGEPPSIQNQCCIFFICMNFGFFVGAQI